MVNNSTDYYRQNKTLKRVVHKCPQCEYSTTGPKISLKHHIDAKHTEESEKPFQCNHCERGFAQKAALINHISNIHNIDVNVKKQTGTIYFISLEKIPTSKKTKARYNYYKKNPIIISNKMKENYYKYLDNNYINTPSLNYDKRNGYIKIKTQPIYSR